jgi:hypothetical protein
MSVATQPTMDELWEQIEALVGDYGMMWGIVPHGGSGLWRATAHACDSVDSAVIEVVGKAPTPMAALADLRNQLLARLDFAS